MDGEAVLVPLLNHFYLYFMTICKEVIISDLARRGSGKDPTSPLRIITQVYEKTGELIAEFDPNGGFTLEEMLSFAEYFSKEGGTIKDWMSNQQRPFSGF